MKLPRDLFLAFVKLHILYHAGRDAVYGLWLIDDRRWFDWIDWRADDEAPIRGYHDHMLALICAGWMPISPRRVHGGPISIRRDGVR